MYVDKLKVNLLVTPEEAIELAKSRTIEDVSICKGIERIFLKRGKNDDRIWRYNELLATIWNAGRVQGIREERIKKHNKKGFVIA